MTKILILNEIEEALSCGEPFFKIAPKLEELFNLGSETVIKQIQEIINDKYNPEDSGDEYWESGNFDDAFEMGIKTGTRDTLYNLANKLNIKVEKPID